MPLIDFIRERAGRRNHNLLLQELRETIERSRVGGFFYPLATALAGIVSTQKFSWHVAAIVSGFIALACTRMCVRADDVPALETARRRLVVLWSIILLTSFAWGAFSVWCFLRLPEPGPLVAVLFSGAFGMAMCHTLCMRRLPASIAILAFMLPCAALLWQTNGAGVAMMWLIYMGYMFIVLVRGYREYRTRLELEEELRQQRDLFEMQTRIDGLTGIANRRQFDDALVHALERARVGGEVSLLILDLDHFKQINDSHGHLAGDACLVVVAGRLQAHFEQPGDVPVRLGGEEFGVILAGDLRTAERRAERFRADLAAAPISVEGRRIALTVSIGCGCFDPDLHEDPDTFYREVDAALYRAKLGGRNRVERVPPASVPVT